MTEEQARLSEMLAAMLEGPYIESKTRRVELSTIPSPVLREVVRYMQWRLDARELRRQGRGHHVAPFTFDEEYLLDTTKAARYLQI